MEEKVDELLPAYLNEFNSSFIRALYKKVTGEEADSWQVERAVATVSGNKTGVSVCVCLYLSMFDCL